MTPVTATLTGSIGLRAGLNRDSLTLDLAAIPNDALTVAIKAAKRALLDEIDTDTEQTPAERIDAEFALFALQMRALIGRLSELFGLGPEI